MVVRAQHREHLEVVEAREDALLGHAQDAGENTLEQVGIVFQPARQEVAEELHRVVVVAVDVAGVDGRVVFVDEQDHGLAVVFMENPAQERQRLHEAHLAGASLEHGVECLGVDAGEPIAHFAMSMERPGNDAAQ
jgi:hypothetical protein